jgi:hypothetical protein
MFKPSGTTMYVIGVMCAILFAIWYTEPTPETSWKLDACPVVEAIAVPTGGVLFPCRDKCCETNQAVTGTLHPQLYEARYRVCSPLEADICATASDFIPACGAEAGRDAVADAYPVGQKVPCYTNPSLSFISIEPPGGFDASMPRILMIVGIISFAVPGYLLYTDAHLPESRYKSHAYKGAKSNE